MKNTWIMVLVFTAWNSGFAAEDSGFAKRAEKASLDQLAALQTFIRAGSEGGMLCAKSEAQGLPAMSQLVEAQIVSRLDSKRKEPLFRELFGDGKRIRECAVKCRCGIYLHWLERAEAGGDREPPSSLAMEVAAWKKELSSRDATLNAKKNQRCAEANRKWICSSTLWSELVRASLAAVESGS